MQKVLKNTEIPTPNLGIGGLESTPKTAAYGNSTGVVCPQAGSKDNKPWEHEKLKKWGTAGENTVAGCTRDV